MNTTNFPCDANFDAPIKALPPRPLVKGCLIRIQSTNVFFDEKYHNAPFLFTMVTFPDGQTLPDRLFLATLTKSIVTPDIYDFANGTANQLVRTCKCWKEALSKLQDKQLQIAQIRIRTIENSNGVHLSKIIDIDLVDLLKKT